MGPRLRGDDVPASAGMTVNQVVPLFLEMPLEQHASNFILDSSVSCILDG
ncbi:MAG: hypothetical protein NT164_04705 [Verrucomicrobiae bacterium]|nr:hypothetical protein [Verrucomicrobiae bacterium]